jgi:serine/threonine-protein kinase
MLILGQLADELQSFGDWGPGVIAISVALLLLAVTRRKRIPLATIMVLGLAFEVAGSFGIAFAEFWGMYAGTPMNVTSIDFFGLSWVAAWTICFTVIVPNRPKYALMAALASGAAVPTTIALSMRYGGTMFIIPPDLFVAGLVFPYVITSGMAFATAQIIFALGSDVRRAQEMGAYELQELIGQGGMGEVWRAHHRMLARPAAVKLIRSDQIRTPDAATTLRRFEQEA